MPPFNYKPPAGGPVRQTKPATPAAPTMSLEDAIAEYQKNNAVSGEAFTAMVPYLQQRGYNVTMTTRAGNTAASRDHLVDDQGRVFDLMQDSDGTAPKWRLGFVGGDYTGNVVGKDGAFVGFNDWRSTLGSTSSPAAPGAAPTVLGSGSKDSEYLAGVSPEVRQQLIDSRPKRVNPFNEQNRNEWKAWQASVKAAGTSAVATAKYQTQVKAASDPIAAANAAASRQRAKGARGGRGSTILAGFNPGVPRTAATTLGGR